MHLVDEVLRRGRQDEAGQPADQHQHQAEHQPVAMCVHSSSRASRHAADADTFFLPAASSADRPVPERAPTRSARRRLGPGDRITAMRISRIRPQLSALGTASVNGAIAASNVSPSGRTIV